MTATLNNEVADLRRANAELQRKLDEALAERDEAQEQQTATAEVLGVINSSPGSLAPVFDAILKKAMRLCGAAFGVLGTYDGERFRSAATHGVSPAYADFRTDDTGIYGPGTGPARLLAGEEFVHIPDLVASEPYQRGDPNRRALVDLGGARASLMVPLPHDHAVMGYIMIYRKEAVPFSEKQIALLQNFAAQAVIAMENARLITETREALEQQTATAEVLQVINSSPGDLAPVFDAMLDKAMRLCEASFGQLNTYEGGRFHTVAMHGVPVALTEFRKNNPPEYGPGTGPARVLAGERIVHTVDLKADEPYLVGDPNRRALVDLGGARTRLLLPLLKEDTVLGTIMIYRQDVRAFSDKQIALLQNFAAQAVIAMENARLMTETREALEQQTATAEVLQVINSSPGDLAPVFDAVLEKAMHLCEAALGVLWTYDGEAFRAAASRGAPPAYAEFLAGGPRRPSANTAHGRLLRGSPFEQIADVAASEDYRLGDPFPRALVDLAGGRTILAVPLRQEGTFLGDVFIYRQEVRPFTNKQIALLQSFAAQAVIAMENARLITETRDALDQQTATAEVLGIINSSPGNLAPVFDAILEKAHTLCGAVHGHLTIYDGKNFRAVATHGVPEQFAQLLRQPFRPGADLAAKLLGGEGMFHIPDMAALTLAPEDQIGRAAVELGGARTLLAVPLRKADALLGYITAHRQEVRPFTEKEIALLQNFAAQAVIAMENARLITETREALDQQTATAEVLQVINSSPGDLAPVFDTMLDKALRLCEAAFGVLWTLDGEKFLAAAMQGVPPAFADYITSGPVMVDPGNAHALIRPGGPLVHLADAMDTEPYRAGDPLRRALVDLGGARTSLAVPLRRDDALLGMFMLYRKEVRPFADKQIALLQNFAAQAVIAMENARLLTETREARDDAEMALRDLRAAQANLIQAEKMASLGQLTAGIAHEIKNPLNFVNNFAALSVELLDELKETTAPAIAALGDDKRSEVDETMEMLIGNLEKIAEHGKRADNIVKSMLEHSRGVSGERREVDLNGLVEEALNLAYHGARAQDQSFNITMERDFDRALRPIDVAPQEITRVFLNLFGNGFYAANKRAHGNGETSFHPTLTVSTRDLGEAVEVKVRDNGTGIPPEIRDKLFQPFFTTKPTGEGTGLGLSISYDIVIQQHGGSITVESEPGEFTEFTVRLPRVHRAATVGARSWA